MIKLDEYISLSEGKTVSGIFSIDWTKTFEGIKTPHRKQDCSDWDNRKICSDCVIKPRMNCSDCKMERARKSCLDLISQKKTYSTDINMLKRKPPNEYHQMLPHYEGIYKPTWNIIDFESAREVLMEWLWKDVLRGYVKWCSVNRTWKTKIILKMKILVYGFKHIKTDTIDNYILFGCESD